MRGCGLKLSGCPLHLARPTSRAVLIQAPLINFAFTGAIFTVILAMRRHGTSASVIGLTQTAIMVGGLVGAIAAPTLQGRFTLSRIVVLLTAAGTLLFAVAAVFIPSPLVALPLAIPLLSPTSNAALFAALLRRTPEAMRGRANNALLQVATGLAALAPLVAGVLLEHLSAHWAMGAASVRAGCFGCHGVDPQGPAASRGHPRVNCAKKAACIGRPRQQECIRKADTNEHRRPTCRR